MENRIFVVDGSAYIYRAYHAVAPLTNSSGLHTHAVVGFVNMIRRLIKDYSPRYLVVTFDSRGPVFRHEIYSDYKANRPPMPEDLAEQIPYIKEFVKASGIPLLEEQDVEADDIIATVAEKFAGDTCEVTIVSGDKDLLQLVGDHVVMLDPMKNKVMNVAEVEEKYGVRVDQLLDTFSLIGDSSDNVPGVPGVGPKTAQKLMVEFDSLEGLYKNVDSMKKSKMKEKIIDNKELAFLSRDLIRLKKDVSIPEELDDYRPAEENTAELTELFTTLEFSRFLKEPVSKGKKIPTDKFHLVSTKAELTTLIDSIKDAELLVVDTETDSLEPRHTGLVGVSLCKDLEQAWYIPVGHVGENDQLLDGQLDLAEVVDALAPIFTDPKILKIGHNLKFDWTVLKKRMNIAMSPLADTMVAAHLLEKGRSLKLDDLCLEEGLELTSFENVVAGDKRSNAFAYVAINDACSYSCEDVYGCLVLWQGLKKQLADNNLDQLFVETEMKLLPILAEMEIDGVGIDETVLSNLSVQFEQQITELEQKIYAETGHEFNLNSPKQLGVVLFEELELPHGRKTKTGYSTDVKVLEKLAGRHPVPALILEYRTIAKLKSTYVDKLVVLKDSVDGRIHTSFNQTITATGRLSSSNPNMQNIPIRMEEGNMIRKAFVPDEGKVFLAADYSQIDLRVLAHYSKDEALIKAFTVGDDIHSRTAAELFNVSTMLINSEMRRVAKSINFGIVYGMSAFGLSQQLSISRKEAQRFIDKYFHLYSGVKTFMHDIVEQARADGYVSTLLGRKRTVVDIDAKNKTKREFAERMAINTPIQGTASDIIKCAMLEVGGALAAEQLSAKMLLQIHDELVFEVVEDEVEQTSKLVKDVMENALPIDVPLVVNCEMGKSLAKG